MKHETKPTVLEWRSSAALRNDTFETWRCGREEYGVETLSASLWTDYAGLRRMRACGRAQPSCGLRWHATAGPIMRGPWQQLPAPQAPSVQAGAPLLTSCLSALSNTTSMVGT